MFYFTFGVWHSWNSTKIAGNDSRVLRNEELVTPLHVDKSPYTRSYSSKSSGVSGSFTRKRRAESSCAADIDGTTKDVILSDPSELHNSWLCTSERLRWIWFSWHIRINKLVLTTLQFRLLCWPLILYERGPPLIFMKLDPPEINFDYFLQRKYVNRLRYHHRSLYILLWFLNYITTTKDLTVCRWVDFNILATIVHFAVSIRTNCERSAQFLETNFQSLQTL